MSLNGQLEDNPLPSYASANGDGANNPVPTIAFLPNVNLNNSCGGISAFKPHSKRSNNVPVDDSMICNVWADNLHEEMLKLREIVDECPYIAMVRYCFLRSSVLNGVLGGILCRIPSFRVWSLGLSDPSRTRWIFTIRR